MSLGLTQQVLWYCCLGLINSPWVIMSKTCIHVFWFDQQTPEKDPTQKGQMKCQEKTKYEITKNKEEDAGPEELETEEVGERN